MIAPNRARALRRLAVIVVVVVGAATLPCSGAPGQAAHRDIVLRNPSNSVHVRIHSCGKTRCATVVWANEKAKQDSARGGTPKLVGTELFKDFREVSPKVWKGKVFVPDLNMTFTGTATVKDENRVVARGCLLGGLGCRSQTWTRVK